MSVQSMNREETWDGAINAVLLLLFLAGGAAMLLFRELPFRLPFSPNDTALWAMGLILLLELLTCLSPLALMLQPPLMFALGSAACLAAQEILQGTAGEDLGLRLLLLVLLVSACFALGGRGLCNALLLARAIRRDPGLLGRSCKLSCVPGFFGIAVLILLCRLLRFS